MVDPNLIERLRAELREHKILANPWEGHAYQCCGCLKDLVAAVAVNYQSDDRPVLRSCPLWQSVKDGGNSRPHYSPCSFCAECSKILGLVW